MEKQKGFSLVEVLVSLLLITSTSALLLRQQCQLSQLFNQLLISTQDLIQRDNDYETSFQHTLK
ncbi:prepilin-type N-terminal cleavage/methylation domain-containing protein [Legionella sp.]|uniref:prepilin-type N-terminal cleavage/methylation domain-containing protein n=1 Tax=Legionella sp. TaxID=459 RepID=UPI00322062A4